MTNRSLKILAISGSLRSNSSNNAVIKAISIMVPDRVEFKVYNGLGDLPHFNDSAKAPVAVQELRTLIKDSDGVLICTPEYAFGVPGSLKNALDWTVGSGEFVEKPVAVITAATGGEKAHASLLHTLTALSAKIDGKRTLLISFIKAKLNEKGEVSDPQTIKNLQLVINELINSL